MDTAAQVLKPGIWNLLAGSDDVTEVLTPPNDSVTSGEVLLALVDE